MSVCPTTIRPMPAELPQGRASAATALLAVAVIVLLSCRGGGPNSEEVLPANGTVSGIIVTSNGFDDGEEIPRKHTCDGEDISPDLHWSDPPASSRSIVVFVDDPDAPGGAFIHWTVIDLSVDIRGLAEKVGNAALLPEGAIHGQNGFGRNGYSGPCPPAGSPHEYRFWVYALSEPLALSLGVKSEDVVTALRGKVVAVGKLTGTYGRP